LNLPKPSCAIIALTRRCRLPVLAQLLEKPSQESPARVGNNSFCLQPIWHRAAYRFPFPLPIIVSAHLN
jgi:hypothetical protein